ncbi:MULTISPECIES: hypothetical protein [Pseudomonadota]|uniref:hypothetical protein n=1 Tax=Pseudomonadota TaxID=1224 RepID=UPI000895C777|nr:MULTISPECIES: hypothetical protein [Pseudomonadota]SEF14481.1 hypothetical protein SAMN02787142_8315 [Burkholderia sp. WP9]SEP48074.1 hypothetical protein SAMN02787149_1342 [Pseudomonas sp. Snoq117.2]
MGMIPSQLDYLDSLAEAVRAGQADALAGLSTGERIYCALAANRADLLPAGYTIVQAFARLDDDATALMNRWEHR